MYNWHYNYKINVSYKYITILVAIALLWQNVVWAMPEGRRSISIEAKPLVTSPVILSPENDYLAPVIDPKADAVLFGELSLGSLVTKTLRQVKAKDIKALYRKEKDLDQSLAEILQDKTFRYVVVDGSVYIVRPQFVIRIVNESQNDALYEAVFSRWQEDPQVCVFNSILNIAGERMQVEIFLNTRDVVSRIEDMYTLMPGNLEELQICQVEVPDAAVQKIKSDFTGSVSAPLEATVPISDIGIAAAQADSASFALYDVTIVFKWLFETLWNMGSRIRQSFLDPRSRTRLYWRGALIAVLLSLLCWLGATGITRYYPSWAKYVYSNYYLDRASSLEDRMERLKKLGQLDDVRYRAWMRSLIKDYLVTIAYTDGAEQQLAVAKMEALKDFPLDDDLIDFIGELLDDVQRMNIYGGGYKAEKTKAHKLLRQVVVRQIKRHSGKVKGVLKHYINVSLKKLNRNAKHGQGMGWGGNKIIETEWAMVLFGEAIDKGPWSVAAWMGMEYDLTVADRALEEIGPAAISGMLDYLQHVSYDQKYQKRVMRVIKRMHKVHDKTVGPVLVRLLEDSGADSARKMLLMNLLHQFQDKGAVPVLIKSLSDNDNEVKIRAAEVLGVLKDKVAVGGLVRLLAEADAGVVVAAREALISIGKSGVSRLIKEVNSMIPERDLSAARQQVLQSCVYALGRIGDSRAVPVLVRLAGDSSKIAAVDKEVIIVLGNFKDKRAIPVLLKIIAAESYGFSDLRDQALLALGKIGGSQVILVLVKELNNDNYPTAEAAGKALVLIGKPAVPLLAKALNAGADSRARRRIPEVLGRIGGTKAVSALVSALNHSSSLYRSLIVRGLGRIEDKTAVAVVIKMLTDKDSTVRYAAVESLAEAEYVQTAGIDELRKLGFMNAIPGLIKLLSDDDDYTRTNAVDVLIKLNESRVLKRRLSKEKHSSIRMRMEDAIKEIEAKQKSSTKPATGHIAQGKGKEKLQQDLRDGKLKIERDITGEEVVPGKTNVELCKEMLGELLVSNKLSSSEEAVLRDLLSDLDDGLCTIGLFDESPYMLGLDDFGLAFQSSISRGGRNRRQIVIGAGLWQRILTAGEPYIKDLLLHEAICQPLEDMLGEYRGHYRAINLQAIVVPEQYPIKLARDRQNKGRMQKLLRRHINSFVNPLPLMVHYLKIVAEIVLEPVVVFFSSQGLGKASRSRVYWRRAIVIVLLFILGWLGVKGITSYYPSWPTYAYSNYYISEADALKTRFDRLDKQMVSEEKYNAMMQDVVRKYLTVVMYSGEEQRKEALRRIRELPDFPIEKWLVDLFIKEIVQKGRFGIAEEVQKELVRRIKRINKKMKAQQGRQAGGVIGNGISNGAFVSLIGLLESNLFSHQMMAFWIIVKIDDPRIIPILLPYLGGNVSSVCVKAAKEAIKRMGERAFPYLIKAAVDNNDINAVEILGELKETRAVLDIGKLLNHQSDIMREYAVRALVSIGDRRAAARELGKFSIKEAIGPLQERLKVEREDSVRREIRKALKKLGKFKKSHSTGHIAQGKGKEKLQQAISDGTLQIERDITNEEVLPGKTSVEILQDMLEQLLASGQLRPDEELAIQDIFNDLDNGLYDVQLFDETPYMIGVDDFGLALHQRHYQGNRSRIVIGSRLWQKILAAGELYVKDLLLHEAICQPLEDVYKDVEDYGPGHGHYRAIGLQAIVVPENYPAKLKRADGRNMGRMQLILRAHIDSFFSTSSFTQISGRTGRESLGTGWGDLLSHRWGFVPKKFSRSRTYWKWALVIVLLFILGWFGVKGITRYYPNWPTYVYSSYYTDQAAMVENRMEALRKAGKLDSKQKAMRLEKLVEYCLLAIIYGSDEERQKAMEMLSKCRLLSVNDRLVSLMVEASVYVQTNEMEDILISLVSRKRDLFQEKLAEYLATLGNKEEVAFNKLAGDLGKRNGDKLTKSDRARIRSEDPLVVILVYKRAGMILMGQAAGKSGLGYVSMHVLLFDDAFASEVVKEIGPAMIPDLLKVLKLYGDERDNREKIVKTILNIGKSAVPVLMRLVEDKDEEIRLLAMEILTQLKDKRSLSVFRKALRSTNYRIRGQAVYFLGTMKDKKATLGLVKLLVEGQVEKQSVGSALTKIGDRKVLPLLREALNDSDSEKYIIGIIYTLGELKDSESTLNLMNILLGDSNPEVREEVASALGKIGDVRALPALRQVAEEIKGDENEVGPETEQWLQGEFGIIEGIEAADAMKETRLQMVVHSAIVQLTKKKKPKASGKTGHIAQGKGREKLQGAINDQTLDIFDTVTEEKIVDDKNCVQVLEEMLQKLIDDGELSEQEADVIRVILTDLSQGRYDIELFDETPYVLDKDDFGLAFHQRHYDGERSQIVIGASLWDRIRREGDSFVKDLLLHEAICQPLEDLHGEDVGHYRAMELQAIVVEENYPLELKQSNGRNMGKMQGVLRDHIDGFLDNLFGSELDDLTGEMVRFHELFLGERNKKDGKIGKEYALSIRELRRWSDYLKLNVKREGLRKAFCDGARYVYRARLKKQSERIVFEKLLRQTKYSDGNGKKVAIDNEEDEEPVSVDLLGIKKRGHLLDVGRNLRAVKRFVGINRKRMGAWQAFVAGTRYVLQGRFKEDTCSDEYDALLGLQPLEIDLNGIRKQLTIDDLLEEYELGNENNESGLFVPLEDTAELVVTKTTRKYLELLIKGLALNHSLLLEGPTGAGKTSLVRYLAYKTNNNLRRFNLNGQTDKSEIIGQKLPDGKGNFVWRNGILLQAMKKGDWLLLDEMNLAEPEILERINSLLDDDGGLVVSEHNGERYVPWDVYEQLKSEGRDLTNIVPIHKNFRLVANMNPSVGKHREISRKKLSPAFLNRFQVMWMDELPRRELVEILEVKFGLKKKMAKKMVAFHFKVADINPDYVFTVRNLMRWAKRITSSSDGVMDLREAVELYRDTMRVDEERDEFNRLFNNVFGFSPDRNDEIVINDTGDYVTIGGARLAKQVGGNRDVPGAEADLVMVPTTKSYLEKIAKGLQYDEKMLLVGPTGSGKTSLVRHLARLTQSRFYRVSLDGQTDAGELSGDLAPRVGESGMNFEWVDGVIIEAMRNGGWLLLDEINLAEPEIMERINSLLDDDASYVVTEHKSEKWVSAKEHEKLLQKEYELYVTEQRDLGVTEKIAFDREMLAKRLANKEIPIYRINENFRIVAAMNPSKDSRGRKRLSKAMLNKFNVKWVPGITDRDEMEEIVQGVLECPNARRIARDMVTVHLAIVAAIEKRQLARKTIEVTVPTLRNLKAWAKYYNHYHLRLGDYTAMVKGLVYDYMDGLELAGDLDEKEMKYKDRFHGYEVINEKRRFIEIFKEAIDLDRYKESGEEVSVEGVIGKEKAGGFFSSLLDGTARQEAQDFRIATARFPAEAKADIEEVARLLDSGDVYDRADGVRRLGGFPAAVQEVVLDTLVASLSSQSQGSQVKNACMALMFYLTNTTGTKKYLIPLKDMLENLFTGMGATSSSAEYAKKRISMYLFLAEAPGEIAEDLLQGKLSLISDTEDARLEKRALLCALGNVVLTKGSGALEGELRYWVGQKKQFMDSGVQLTEVELSHYNMALEILNAARLGDPSAKTPEKLPRVGTFFRMFWGYFWEKNVFEKVVTSFFAGGSEIHEDRYFREAKYRKRIGRLRSLMGVLFTVAGVLVTAFIAGDSLLSLIDSIVILEGFLAFLFKLLVGVFGGYLAYLFLFSLVFGGGYFLFKLVNYICVDYRYLNYLYQRTDMATTADEFYTSLTKYTTVPFWLSLKDFDGIRQHKQKKLIDDMKKTRDKLDIYSGCQFEYLYHLYDKFDWVDNSSEDLNKVTEKSLTQFEYACGMQNVDHYEDEEQDIVVYDDAVKIFHITLPINKEGEKLYVPTPEAADLEKTFTTKKNLEKAAQAVELNEPLLFVGPTGAGKTSLIRYLAYLTNNNFRRFNLNGQTDKMEITGGYYPEGDKMQWAYGILLECMEKGDWLLLDELNLAEPEILERINSLLDDDRSLDLREYNNEKWVPEEKYQWLLDTGVISEEQRDGKAVGVEKGTGCIVRRINPNFRLFATMNPSDYIGRKKLSPAFMNRFRVKWTEELPPSEIMEIILKRYPIDVPGFTNTVFNIMKFYKQISFAAEARIIGRGQRQPYCFTIRTLMSLMQRVYERMEEGGEPFGQVLGEEIIYVFRDGLRDPKDIDTFNNKIVPFTLSLNLQKVEQRMEAKEDFMADTGIEVQPEPHLRTPGPEAELVPVPSTRKYLRKLARAIKANDKVLLAGFTGTGKTSMVKDLAYRTNNGFMRVGLDAHTDTSELIGEHIPKGGGDFGWKDGILIEAMKTGSWILLDEFNLAAADVMERINSLLDDDGSLVVTEHLGEKWVAEREYENLLWEEMRIWTSELKKQHSGVVPSWCSGMITNAESARKFSEQLRDILSDRLTNRERPIHCIHKNFRIIAAMNPERDSGRQPLSPAIRNKFTEIWVADEKNESELQEIVKHRLQVAVPDSTFVEQMVRFHMRIIEGVAGGEIKKIKNGSPLTLRDLSAWVQYINTFGPELNATGAAVRGVVYTYCEKLEDKDARRWIIDIFQEIFEITPDDFDFVTSSDEFMEDTDAVFVGNLRLEKRIRTVPDKDVPALSEAQLVQTARTRESMRMIIEAVQADDPLLFVGHTGVGKTSVIRYTAALTNNGYRRFNLSGQTDKSEFIGQYAQDITGKWQWRNGILLEAMAKGDWLVLDEMNLAESQIIERINSLLDDDGSLMIPEHENEMWVKEREYARLKAGGKMDEVTEDGITYGVMKDTGQKIFKIHAKFRIFATMNPMDYAGRKKMSPALMNRFRTKWVEPLTKEEMKEILTHEYNFLSVAMVNNIVEMHFAIANKLEGRSYITLRHLQRLLDRVKFSSWQDEAGLSALLAREAVEIYVDEVREEDFANSVRTIIQSYLGVVNEVGADYEIIDNGDTVSFGDVVLEKHEGGVHVPTAKATLVNTRTARGWLRKLAKSIFFGEKLLLVGPTGSSKTSYVRYLAHLVNANFRRMNLDGMTDVSELIGEYVQDEQVTDDLKFKWKPGILLEAMENGDWVLLDEINLAEPEILERINSLLDDEGGLVVTECGSLRYVPQHVYDRMEAEGQDMNNVKPIHKNFRLIAAMNPARYAGRKRLSKAFYNKFNQKYISDQMEKGEPEQIVRYFLTGKTDIIQPTQQGKVSLGADKLSDSGPDAPKWEAHKNGVVSDEAEPQPEPVPLSGEGEVQVEEDDGSSSDGSDGDLVTKMATDDDSPEDSAEPMSAAEVQDLEAAVQIVTHDRSIRLKKNPKDGWAYDLEANVVYYPEGYPHPQACALHEAGHRIISRVLDMFFFQRETWRALWNAIDDPRVNNWIMHDVNTGKEELDKLYEVIFPEDGQGETYRDDLVLPHLQFTRGIIHYWVYGKEHPAIVNPKVLAALQKTRTAVVEAYSILPGMVELSVDEQGRLHLYTPGKNVPPHYLQTLKGKVKVPFTDIMLEIGDDESVRVYKKGIPISEKIKISTLQGNKVLLYPKFTPSEKEIEEAAIDFQNRVKGDAIFPHYLELVQESAEVIRNQILGQQGTGGQQGSAGEGKDGQTDPSGKGTGKEGGEGKGQGKQDGQQGATSGFGGLSMDELPEDVRNILERRSQEFADKLEGKIRRPDRDRIREEIDRLRKKGELEGKVAGKEDDDDDDDDAGIKVAVPGDSEEEDDELDDDDDDVFFPGKGKSPSAGEDTLRQLMELEQDIYDKYLIPILPQVEKLVGYLENELLMESKPRYKGYYRTGKKVSMRKLMQYKASNYSPAQSKIWLRKTKPVKYTHRFSLVVDLSASMGNGEQEGDPLYYAIQGIVMFLEVLERLDIGCSVIGFANQAHAFKEDFDRPLSREEKCELIRKLLRRSGGGTNDKDAVAKGIEMLKQEDADTKVMIVMTDGVGYAAVVRRLTDNAFEDDRIDTMAIPINCGTEAKKAYPHVVVADDMETIPVSVKDILAEKIFPSIYGGMREVSPEFRAAREEDKMAGMQLVVPPQTPSETQGIMSVEPKQSPIRKARIPGPEIPLFTGQIDRFGNVRGAVLEPDNEKFGELFDPEMLAVVMEILGNIYGIGIFSGVKRLRIVDNIDSWQKPGATKEEVSVGNIHNDVVTIDIDSFRSFAALFEVIEHELNEGMIRHVETNETIGEILAIFRNVKRFQDPVAGLGSMAQHKYREFFSAEKYRAGLLEFLEQTPGIDPDGSYQRLLQGSLTAKSDSELMALVLDYLGEAEIYRYLINFTKQDFEIDEAKWIQAVKIDEMRLSKLIEVYDELVTGKYKLGKQIKVRVETTAERVTAELEEYAQESLPMESIVVEVFDLGPRREMYLLDSAL